MYLILLILSPLQNDSSDDYNEDYDGNCRDKYYYKQCTTIHYWYWWLVRGIQRFKVDAAYFACYRIISVVVVCARNSYRLGTVENSTVVVIIHCLTILSIVERGTSSGLRCKHCLIGRSA